MWAHSGSPLPTAAVELLGHFGEWMHRHTEADSFGLEIYGTVCGPCLSLEVGAFFLLGYRSALPIPNLDKH
jgi:hypothetical protein